MEKEAPPETEEEAPKVVHQPTDAAKKRIHREQVSLDSVKQYRIDLPGVIEQVKQDFEAQVANVLTFLDEKAADIEQKVEACLEAHETSSKEEEELLQITEKLQFDIQASCEPLVEEMMQKLQKQLGVVHIMADPVQTDTRPYLWS